MNELPPHPERYHYWTEPEKAAIREYGRACQQADDELLRQAGFAFRSVWAIGLTGENVHLIEAAMLAIEARLGADK